MLVGVTYSGVVLNAMICIMPFILFNKFIYLALMIPIHIIMWGVCRWDARFFDLLWVWLQTSARAKYRNLWQGAAYRQ